MGRFDSQFEQLTNSRWAYAVIAGLVFLLSLPGLFALPVLDRDEGRFTEASSEMMESGDFVVIRYHDELRNKKPVAIHWFQSMAVSLTSGAHERNIWDYRIPSMLGAIMAALATFWGGLALFTRRAAFISAIVIGTTLLLTTEANIGKTDAALCGFMTLGLAALAHIRAGATSKRLSILFWACLSIGVLLKGPIAPLVVAGTIAALFVWERRIGWARPLLYWGGISLFVVMTVPWYVAVQIATEGAFLSEAVGVDLGPKLIEGAEGHDGPFGMHTAALPVLFWPGTILLVPGLWLAFTSLRANRQVAQTGELAAARRQRSRRRRARSQRLALRRLLAGPVLARLRDRADQARPLRHADVSRDGADGGRRRRPLVLHQHLGPWPLDLRRAVRPRRRALRHRPDAVGAGRTPRRCRRRFRRRRRTRGWRLGKCVERNRHRLLAHHPDPRSRRRDHLCGREEAHRRPRRRHRRLLRHRRHRLSRRHPAEPGVDAPHRRSAVRAQEVCALPEGTSAWKDSGCEGRAPKLIRSIAYAEPSFVFELGNKVILPAESNAAIPPIAEDNRPAWLINIGEEAGRKALDELIDSAVAADRCVRLARRFVLNYSNGDPSELVAAVVEPAGCPDSDEPPSLRPTTEDEEPPVLEE